MDISILVPVSKKYVSLYLNVTRSWHFGGGVMKWSRSCDWKEVDCSCSSSSRDPHAPKLLLPEENGSEMSLGVGENCTSRSLSQLPRLDLVCKYKHNLGYT